MSRHPAGLPFAEFLEHLRHQGFEIGVDHHLRLQMMLDRLGPGLTPENLKTHLGPIFATSPEQQAQFHRAFESFYPLFVCDQIDRDEDVRRPAGHAPRTAATRERPSWKRGWAPRLALVAQFILAAAAVLIVLTVAVESIRILRWRSGEAAVDTAPSVADESRPAAGDSAPSIPPSPAQAAQPESAPAAPDPAVADAMPAAEAAAVRDPARRPTGIPLGLLVLMPLVGFALYEVHLLRRRQLVLVRERRSEPPLAWPLQLESRGQTLFGGDEFRLAARDMRQRQEADIARLDVEASITATIDAAGYPTLRFTADTRPPEYLLLVERTGFRDHLADMYMELGRTLSREGVHVEPYYFERDPRVCSSESGQRHVLLSELRQRFPFHRLLVIGSGEQLLDPVSGVLAPWVPELLTWRERALLTPEPVTCWGMREVTLAGHFIVLPASAAGLSAAIDHFNAESRPRLRTWKQKIRDEAPPELDGGGDIEALRGYLGPDAFQWLCACALYPELQWDLTLYLGSLPGMGDRLLNASNVLKVVRLPWFRDGSIPDETRWNLLQQIDADVERAARLGIIDLLERSPPPAGSIAADRRRLNLIVQRAFLQRHDEKQRRNAARELRHVTERQIEQDYALLQLLDRAKLSGLALQLPKRLRKIFYRQGIPAFGLRTGFRLSTALALTAILALSASLITAGQAKTGAAEATLLLSSLDPEPDFESLQRLDAARGLLIDLERYENAGILTRQWVRISGVQQARSELRRAYFRRLDDILLDDTRNLLTDYLRGLPAMPTETSGYSETYDALKAYLAMTARPDQSDRVYMTPTLLAFWSAANPDPERAALVTAQFDFFADELAIENPYAHVVDEAIVDQTRRFLRGFAGADQFYRVLLSEAGDGLDPVRWSDPIVRSDVVVPGAFTRAGWERVQAILADVPRLFDRDTWVVGETGIPTEDRDRLAQELRTRYATDYTGNWLRFLQAARVTRFSGVDDAARALAVLSTNQSPLMRLLGIVSENTAVDTTLVGVAFQPVQNVVAPESTSPTQIGGQYLNTLAALQAALNQVNSSSGNVRTQAALQANVSVLQVRAEVAGLARNFSTVGDAREVGTAVASLLQGPAVTIESLIVALPAAEVNAKGIAFCAPFASLANRFPFNPGASSEASLDAVVNALAPGAGALRTFLDTELQSLLLRQGTNWVARPGASPQPNPAFVTFINQATQVSGALFDEGVGRPQVLFTLRVETNFEIPEVTITVGGRAHTFTRTQPSSPPFMWDGTVSTARISARVGNDNVTVFEAPASPWAAFRMFYAAQMATRGGGRYDVTWPIPGRQDSINGELSLEGGVPIFQRSYLSQLGQCVSRIAR